MKALLRRYLCFLVGCAVCSVGIVLSVNANIGLSPWDVFHQGLANLLGITFGNASIVVGLIIVTLDWLLGERIGIGTVLNIVLVGIMLDGIQATGLIPIPQTLVGSLLMMTLSLAVIGVGTYLYICPGLGSGPRDALMVAMVKRMPRVPVGLLRALTEGGALLVGWLLGGPVGIGTIYSMIGIGVAIQWVFQLFHFEAGKLHQEDLLESLRNFSAAWKETFSREKQTALEKK